MFRPQTARMSEPRRGVILLVVISLLTLFAIVGVSFVLYADSEAKSSQIFREAEVQSQPDLDPTLAFSYFLGQLIYDVRDDASGVYSALRGHSLARLMYGSNSEAANTIPFNGTGRLYGPSPIAGVDDYFLINYTYFASDSFLRDPERLGWRQTLGQQPGPYAGGFNAPYTYPDLNNMFLAAVRATDGPDGPVLIPSYHRPWLFGPLNDPNNPNWTNAQGKYLTLRPREFDQRLNPQTPSAFPYPEDGRGDVKNLVGSPGGNDSIWIDIGAPVMVAPNGRKYKMLVAPLILDLDNRVNLNVHGNLRGANGTHASNQGWGPWAIDLGQVLTAPNGEWTRLFSGTTTPLYQGRYGMNRQPGQPGDDSAIPGTAAHFYALPDYDESNELKRGEATLPYQLPLAGTFFGFPTFPEGYGNGGIENEKHPSVFNFFDPGRPGRTGLSRRDDRVLPLSNMEALLRYGDTGSPTLTSDLFRLCPTNFQDPKIRRLVTTHSFDLSRPGAAPWIWPDPAEQTQPYQLRTTAQGTFPTGVALSLPTPANPLPRYPLSEFAADWRSNSALWGRVDLNRKLPDYPVPVAGRIAAADLPTFLAAQQARQQLARDIYHRLRLVTLGNAIEPPQAAVDSPDFNTLRWLAQLAVNIVDYIDADDYMTPFDWYNNPGTTVFGTELPRVVLNEAYAEVANDPQDRGPDNMVLPRAVLPLKVNFWVELHNPFKTDPTLPDRVDPANPALLSAARLQIPAAGSQSAYAAHQVVVARSQDATLRQAPNVLGDPNPTNVLLTVSSYTPAPAPAPQPVPGVDVSVLKVANGSYAGIPGSNEGFYVLGPKYDSAGAAVGRPQVTLRVNEQVVNGVRSAMTYDVPLDVQLDASQLEHMILLRRLACPYLPPNPATPGGAINVNTPYNPYITVDYMDRIPTSDAVRADGRGLHNPTPVNARRAVGRVQPYAGSALPLFLKAQQPDPALATEPQHTFFRHNGETNPYTPRPAGTLKTPFDWLVHLDRQLISPMELLQVSGCKPHELTQEFMGPQTLLFNHRAPWLNQQTRLYRVFEFLETCNRAAGMTVGGRIPGKININTIWDPETFLALCDPQLGNHFTRDEVQSLYQKLVALRTPTNGIPAKDDRPFWGMAPGLAPATGQALTQGIDSTLLRADGVGGGTSAVSRRLFEIGQGTALNPVHPYLRYELLTKIYNQLTTRSNVFAVWATTGFFEVARDTDPATGQPIRPVKLGAEIGRAENRHLRHRMFAIVDRTNLTLVPGQAPVFLKSKSPVTLAPNTATVTVPVEVDTLTGLYDGVPWTIQKGSRLRIDDGPNQEDVTVRDVALTDPTTAAFSATFTKPHPTNCLITLLNDNPQAMQPVPGNPGPILRYDARLDPAVVRYLSIID